MGCSASCSRLVGLAEIRTTRSRATNSTLHGTLALRQGRRAGPPLPQPPRDRSKRGRSLNWEGLGQLGGGPLAPGTQLAPGAGPERENNSLNWDPNKCWNPGPKPGRRGAHSKVILFSSRTSWSASTVQS